MRLRIRDIEETPKELVYDEPTTELNPLLAHGTVRDFTFAAPAAVRLHYYRSGQEIFLDGEASTAVVGQCARCLEEFEVPQRPRFSFVLVPRHGRWAAEDVGTSGDLIWYEGEQIDVSPLVREQMLLALPTLPLCHEECRGLCPHCGTNLNLQPCTCVAEVASPFGGLQRLKMRR